MTDKTEDALNVSLAHPGTNYLASIDEIKDMPKNAIFPTANYPYEVKMKKAEYEEEKRLLQIELAKFQHWIKDSGQKYLIIFEGRDAAGKESVPQSGFLQRFCLSLLRDSDTDVYTAVCHCPHYWLDRPYYRAAHRQ